MVDLLVSRVDAWSLIRYCYITLEVHPRVSYYTQVCTQHARGTLKRAQGFSSRAKNAVFLPGCLAYCLSEGDLWFTSDNRTIILCAHSLSVEAKIQKEKKKKVLQTNIEE